jgi:hypothetical protein
MLKTRTEYMYMIYVISIISDCTYSAFNQFYPILLNYQHLRILIKISIALLSFTVLIFFLQASRF